MHLITVLFSSCLSTFRKRAICIRCVFCWQCVLPPHQDPKAKNGRGICKDIGIKARNEFIYRHGNTGFTIFFRTEITGYKQSVTGCGSQRRQCSCYSTKVVFFEHHTHFNVYVSQRIQIQFEDEDHAVNISFR